MQKRGTVELVVLIAFAAVALGALFVVNNPVNQTVDISGAPTVGRTVPRTSVPQECARINSLMIRIKKDIELTIDAYKELYVDIQAILKLKQKIITISNTKLKAAVLTCRDWHGLVPGLSTYVSCGEIDTIDEDEQADQKLEGKTCEKSDRCTDRFAFSKCDGPEEGGDKSLSCSCERVQLTDGAAELCVPERDRELHILQVNVWKMKKIIRTLTLKLKINIEKYEELHVKLKQSLDVWIKMDGELKSCFERRCITDCPQDSYTSPQQDRPGSAISTPRDAVSTPREISTPREPTPVDCETECAKRGMSTSPPSSSAILSELQQHRCVSGGKINMKTATVGNCKCYGKPDIQIDFTKPVCKGSPCGDVECDGEKKCPCPDKPNCTLTVRCTWGGWKQVGQYSFAPQLGSASGHLS